MGLRRNRRWVIVLTVAALLVAACGGSSEDDDKTADTSGGGGGAGGNLVVGTIEVPSTIDPANVYEKFASDVLFNTTNRLVEYPPGATEPEPGLATDWEISDDGLTYTFTLREGVKFQDGSDFDSEDVKYSLERAINVNDPDGASFLLQTRDEDSGEPVAGIESIETPDPTTVVITLVAPNTTFLSRLNYTVASIVPSDGDYKAPDEVLTGDVAGQLAELARTPTDRRHRSVRAAELQARRVDGPQALRRLLGRPGEDRDGHRPVLRGVGAAEQRPRQRRDRPQRQRPRARPSAARSADSVTTFQGDGARIRYLVIDVTKPPFDDVEVRKALAAAVDRQRIVDEVFEGDAELLTSMIPASFDQYAEGLLHATSRASPADAKIKFDLWYPLNKYGDTEADMAEKLKRTLNESGAVRGHDEERRLGVRVRRQHRRGLALRRVHAGLVPGLLRRRRLHRAVLLSSQGFLGHYKDDEMDALVKQEQTETDEAERTEIFDEIQKKAAEDMPYIPLYTDAAFAYYQKGS